MGEAENQLLHQAVLAHCAGDGHGFCIGRQFRYEMIPVEVTQLGLAAPACHGRDMVDIRSIDHGGHGLVRVPVRELTGEMLVPELLEIEFIDGHFPSRPVRTSLL
ncbi:MAG: hypothetical protein IPM23_21555 [Candidatus Melainabacteria bacterium]|nr:hypothetical protein [Candidatus Melainabacteria bacterium]